MRVPVSITTLVCALAFIALPSQAASQPLVAVLDFRATDLELSAGELGLLTEGARKVAVERLGSTYGIITRENLEDLLRAHGKTLEQCQGACETETGRMLGAELVVTGHATRAFGEIHLTMKIHRTDPPTLLAAELGKTSGTGKLPALTQAVSVSLLERVSSGSASESTAASASSAPGEASPNLAGRKLPPTKPEKSRSAQAESYDGFLRAEGYPEGYPQPTISWIAFRGALQAEADDAQLKSRWLTTREHLTDELQRETSSAERAQLLKSRAERSFHLSVLEASERSRRCWARHVRRGEHPSVCSQGERIEVRTALEDIKAYQEITGFSVDRFPDELMFTMAFITLSSATSSENKRAALGWLEKRLVSTDHVPALLFLGKHKLHQGELYTAARLLTRAVDLTEPVEFNGAFARYLLAWTHMIDDHLGEGHLAQYPLPGGSAERRWGEGAGVAANLLSEVVEQLIQSKRWDRIDTTAPALLRLLRDDQALNEDVQSNSWIRGAARDSRPSARSSRPRLSR